MGKFMGIGKCNFISICLICIIIIIYSMDRYGCNWEGKDFVFIHCGKKNLDPQYEYWGGVRFSVKEFEQEHFHSRIHDAVTHTSVRRHESILEYVQVRQKFTC